MTEKNWRHPYETQGPPSFWSRSIGKRHYSEISDLWSPIELKQTDKIATAGSCFAQHIGANLAKRGANFMDMEPAPPVFSSSDEARRWGYGVFSCRYGNVYTTRQLLQLFDEAFGHRKPADRVWSREGRYFDALRPGIDPVGQSSAEDVISLRADHLQKVQEMFRNLDLFVFTLGLTEGWESKADGTVYPIAPGVIAGNYEPDAHRLLNLRTSDVRSDLEAFREKLKAVNPGARILLTVSPVPLAATATENHVLVATTWSKSVLRSVAGEISADFEDVSYFPSYEIISSHASRGMFFDPDLRNVNPFGVELVMKKFFVGELAKEFPSKDSDVAVEEFELICDEERLDAK